MVGNSNVTYGGARVLIVHISGSCTWKPRLSSAKNTFILKENKPYTEKTNTNKNDVV